MNTFPRIYKIVSKIPRGKVLTYKQIADYLKLNNPKIVGFALHANKNSESVPCHRVVKNDGTLAIGYAFGGIKKQEELLKKEGIAFLKKGVIDLKKFQLIF